MIATFKIIGLASALSAGVVTAYDLPRQSPEPAGKTYYDRILPSDEVEVPKTVVALSVPETTGSVQASAQPGKGDRLGDQPKVQDPSCSAQTWPNISRDCLVAENGTPIRKPARTITIEKREGANTSALVRVPATGVASR
ncbi:MAG TPA: hypothetical protein VF744_19695 [Beijerinckiaceae bacterium]|jgi:hypothetical protein